MEHSVAEKSFLFAIRIVNLYKHIIDVKKEVVLSKQLLRCGTSIGANIAEAHDAQSRADFISKQNIALKEANETEYWLRLLHATNYLTDAEFQSIYVDCQQLQKMLISIIKTSKLPQKK